jgi:PAS domain S-box-containing protein
MKNKKGQTVTAAILEDKTDALELLKDINNLTVEDVVVIYAYAEAIVETVREPLVILDEKLRIKTVNKSFFDTFKVNKEETYNKLIFDLGNGQWNIPSLRKLLTELLPKSTHFKDYEVTHKFDDIGERTMLLNARRIVLEGQKTELILLAIEDITERKTLEQQKDDFIGIASHELKTPLTSIKAYTQILLKILGDSGNKPALQALNRIDSQLSRLNDLVRDLLDVSRIQTGRLDLKSERFHIRELLEEVATDIRNTVSTHTLTMQHIPNCTIYGDKNRIGQVLTNLIENAIKYSPDADTVIINIKKHNQKLIASVKDFGVGIPKEDQAKVFDRFYRVKAHGDRFQGQGLGLFIAAEIIKQHGGEILVDSVYGKGSTFCFTLPLGMGSNQKRKKSN